MREEKLKGPITVSVVALVWIKLELQILYATFSTPQMSQYQVNYGHFFSIFPFFLFTTNYQLK